MNKRTKEQIRFSIFLKSILIIAVLYGLITVPDGLMAFTKFTTLSNLGIASAMGVFIKSDLTELKTGKDVRTTGMYDFKFMMTAAIMLTFFVFLCILAPTYPTGFIGAYLKDRCGSIAHHLVSPLVAIFDFYYCDKDYTPTIKTALYSAIAPILYIFFIMILAALGVRWKHGMSAPYNFMNFGAPTGWWGFDLSIMDSSTLGIGVAYMIILLTVLFFLMAYAMIAIKKHT